MKKLLFLLIFCLLSLAVDSQIIADHTVVDRYDDIPSNWIDSVKKMHIAIPGTSHAMAYYEGLKLLEAIDPRYDVNVSWNEPYTDSHLRWTNTWSRPSSEGGYYGVEEELWHTWKAWPEGTAPAEKDSIKNFIKRNYDNGIPIHAIGFGWCVDFMSSYVSQVRDPVYKVRWMGPAVGSPDYGHKGWGLDADDYSITSNRVCMDTYLNANLDYQAYCDANGYPTEVIYTTGVADSMIYYGEPSYQRYIKNEYLRDFVKADPTRILLDYEDIVCYDDGSSVRNEAIWSYDGVNYSYPYITTRNAGDYSKGHIGNAGALRLGKAVWWMLARMAGWDGGTTGTKDLSEDKLSSPLIKYTHDEIRINIDDTFLATTASLYNLQGSLLSTQTANGDSIIINIANLPAGIYFVVLSNSKNTKTHKILIS